MHQNIDQGFAQCSMHRGFLLPLCPLQLKRNLQICRQLQINLAVKIIKIARPFTIQSQTINPAAFRARLWPLLIIQHVKRQDILDDMHLPEHQQASQGQPLLTGFPIALPASNFLQKRFIRQGIPRVPRVAIGKYLPISLKRTHIQVCKLIMWKDFVVPAVFHLLGQHPLDLFVSHQTVAFIQATICMPKRIVGEIHRPRFTRCARHLNQQQCAAIHFMLAHIGITQQVDAHFLPIVQVIEQFHAYLGDILNTNGIELPFALAHPPSNKLNSPVSISMLVRSRNSLG